MHSSSPAQSTVQTRVAEQLSHGGIRADAIHGNKSQNVRQRAFAGFRDGRLRVLVATDIGIDIGGISHVITQSAGKIDCNFCGAVPYLLGEIILGRPRHPCFRAGPGPIQSKLARSSSGAAAFARTEGLAAIGTVKWFTPTKGYGFVQPEDG